MYVAIFGSRELTYSATSEVRQYVHDQLFPGDVVVSGGARGTDRIAEMAALQALLQVVSFRPYKTKDGTWAINRVLIDQSRGFLDWEQTCTLPERYPTFAAAAFVRNGYIVELGERGVCWWDGKSRGTKDTLRKAQAEYGVDGVDLHHFTPLQRGVETSRGVVGNG